MLMEKIAGLFHIILGLLLIIYPLISSAVISITIGFALVCFGISTICMSIIFRNDINKNYSYLSSAIGILSILLGIIFIFFIDALSFLVFFQFYIIGFIMVVYAIMGIIYLKKKNYIIRSIIMLILGILVFLLSVFAASQPLLIAILIGVSLIIEGIFIIVLDSSYSLSEKYA